MFEPLRLPSVRNAAGGSLVLARTLQRPTIFQRLGHRCTRPMFDCFSPPFVWSSDVLGSCWFWVWLHCGGCPDLEAALLTLATRTVPSRSLCQPGLSSPHLGSASMNNFFLVWRSRVPTVSASTSRFSGISQQGDKCSSYLVGVPLVLDGLGSCSVDPCASTKHNGSPWLELPLAFLLESLVKECSLGSGLISDFLILFAWVEGGKSIPPSRATMLHKAKLHVKGPLVSQKVLFLTDLLTAIHPIGTVLTP